MLYFVALIPPPPEREEIHRLKIAISETYHTRRALNSPPHITLINPFELKEQNRGQWYAFLMEFSQNQEPVKIKTNGFSHFRKEVLFLEIVKTQGLSALQNHLDTYARKKQNLFKYHYPERTYHPHITLAFKDLTKENFNKAWIEFKDLSHSKSFNIRQLSLLRHNGKFWEIDAIFSFKNK